MAYGNAQMGSLRFENQLNFIMKKSKLIFDSMGASANKIAEFVVKTSQKHFKKLYSILKYASLVCTFSSIVSYRFCV